MKGILKRLVCVATSVFLVAGITIYDDAETIDAAVESRTYYKHLCSSPDPTSYTTYTLSLSASSQFSVSRAVIGEDNRIPDYDTRIVQLDGPGGTGFIVDDHIIATNVHCVYNGNTDSFQDITIRLFDENGDITETIDPVSLHIPELFFTDQHYNYDYALITVEEDLSEYGMFSLGLAQDDLMTSGMQVTVSGFPGEYYGTLYKGTGNLLPINDSNQSYQIKYDADATGGQSGSPVYITQTHRNKTYQTVIGIHKSSGNYGVRITQTLLMFYYNNAYL